MVSWWELNFGDPLNRIWSSFITSPDWNRANLGICCEDQPSYPYTRGAPYVNYYLISMVCQELFAEFDVRKKWDVDLKNLYASN